MGNQAKRASGTQNEADRQCRKHHGIKALTIFSTAAILAIACAGCNSADKADDAVSEAKAEQTKNNRATSAPQSQDTEQTVVNDNEVEQPSLPPLTQYALVEVLDGNLGVGFRSKADVILEKLGFTVKKRDRPADADEMEPYISMTAHRQEKDGSTNVVMQNGEDQQITIDFASSKALEAFVESMRKSGYEYEGGIYSHPKNALGKIYAKVEGSKVKLISPFEMLPNNW